MLATVVVAMMLTPMHARDQGFVEDLNHTIPHTILKPGYGVRFDHQGKLLHSLHTWDLIVALRLPWIRSWTHLGPMFQNTLENMCEQVENMDYPYKTCSALLNIVMDFKQRETYHQKYINQLINHDMRALLPDPESKENIQRRRGYHTSDILMQRNPQLSVKSLNIIPKKESLSELLTVHAMNLDEFRRRQREMRERQKIVKRSVQDEPESPLHSEHSPTETTDTSGDLDDMFMADDFGLRELIEFERNPHRLLPLPTQTLKEQHKTIKSEFVPFALSFWDEFLLQRTRNVSFEEDKAFWLDDPTEEWVPTEYVWEDEDYTLEDGLIVDKHKTITDSTSVPSNMTDHSRQKRWISLLMGLGGLLIKGVSSYMDYRKDKAMREAINFLLERTHNLEGAVHQVNEDLVAVAQRTMHDITQLKEAIDLHTKQLKTLSLWFTQTVGRLRSRTAQIELAVDYVVFILSQVKVHMDRAIDLYVMLESRGEHFLDSIEDLSVGQINHEIVHPADLSKYLKSIQQTMARNKIYQNYELALTHIHQYYAVDLASFNVLNDHIVIHYPIFMKQTTIDPVDLYEISSVPIAYNPDSLQPTKTGKWYGPHTEFEFNHKYLAISPSNYMELHPTDLSPCHLIFGTYYCSTLFVTKNLKKPSCAAAIILNKTSEVLEVCEIKHYENLEPTPTIWSTADYIYLVDVPSPWKLQCDEDNDIPFTSDAKPIALIKRKDLCACALITDDFFLQQDILYCNEEKPGSGARIWYTTNTAVATSFTEFVDGLTKIKDSYELEFKKAKEHQMQRKSVILDGDTISDMPLNLTMPEAEIMVEDRKLAEIMDEEPVIETTLDKVIDTIKEKKLGFATKADYAMYAQKVTNWVEAKRWVNIFLVTAGVLGIVGFIIGTFAIKKWAQIRMMYSKTNTQQAKLAMAAFAMQQMIGKTEAMEIRMKKIDPENVELSLNYEYKDAVMLAAMWCTSICLIFLITKLAKKIVWKKQHFLNQKSHCKNWICSGWSDQTDVYVQVASQECQSSQKFYIGTILGQPSSLDSMKGFSVGHISLEKGFVWDTIQIEWKYPMFKVNQDLMTLPKKVHVGFFKRILSRHIFKTSEVLCNIAFVYNNQLLLKDIPNQNSVTTQFGAVPFPGLHDELTEIENSNLKTPEKRNKQYQTVQNLRKRWIKRKKPDDKDEFDMDIDDFCNLIFSGKLNEVDKENTLPRMGNEGCVNAAFEDKPETKVKIEISSGQNSENEQTRQDSDPNSLVVIPLEDNNPSKELQELQESMKQCMSDQLHKQEEQIDLLRNFLNFCKENYMDPKDFDMNRITKEHVQSHFDNAPPQPVYPNLPAPIAPIAPTAPAYNPVHMHQIECIYCHKTFFG